MSGQQGDRSPSTPRTDRPQYKRQRGTPTFQTPHRLNKRLPLREAADLESSARRLTFSADTETSQETWSDAELQALVEFVLFHGTGECWPTHKRTEYWKNAADFVKMRAKTSRGRTSEFDIHVIINGHS